MKYWSKCTGYCTNKFSPFRLILVRWRLLVESCTCGLECEREYRFTKESKYTNRKTSIQTKAYAFRSYEVSCHSMNRTMIFLPRLNPSFHYTKWMHEQSHTQWCCPKKPKKLHFIKIVPIQLMTVLFLITEFKKSRNNVFSELKLKYLWINPTVYFPKSVYSLLEKYIDHKYKCMYLLKTMVYQISDNEIILI